MRFLFYILLSILIPAALGLYSNQPRFRSENGHLYIESSTSHNVSLNIKGQGYINVNNENLLQIIRLAKEAWDEIESFRSNDLPEFADSVKAISPMFDGPKSLTDRVTSLEMQMMNGTLSSTLPSKGKSETVLNAGKLEIRLNNLEKKINILTNLLSTSECLSNPCQNGGTCMDLYNGFQCNCPHNWQGKQCELDVDECVRFLHTDLGCQNGAECKNTPGSYECLCAPNWYGLRCTKKKNDCNFASSSELCGNGVCINQASAIGYTCICNQGWTTEDGRINPACTKDVDECKENSHTCSAEPLVECKNTRGSFTCGNCPIGFEGDGFLCTDVNECLVDNGGCSTNPRVPCINTRGSFKCGLCPPGYSGDGFNCVYIDNGGACAINNGGCHPNADCTVYAETTIQCTCRRGYVGNGHVCVKDSSATNVCANNPCGLHGSCISNGNNTFSCECNEGYIGNTCNIHRENPCFRNPCRNGYCIPEMESYTYSCHCDPGYFGDLCDSALEQCGGFLFVPNITIRHPESNTTYLDNENCVWNIIVNETKVLNISFVWIDVEKSIDCFRDYIEITNNEIEGGRTLGKFCGNTLPMNNSIISDSNHVLIHFHSDSTMSYLGFELQYTSINPYCGGVIHIDSHGTLSSPGSPGKYPPNRDCYWTLDAQPEMRIQLLFFSLQLEHHVNCSYDYLEIRDGITQQSPVLAKLCNSVLPSPILTSGSNAHLYFHSDDNNQDYGFQMAYSLVTGVPGCGGIHTAPMGIITSPTDFSSDTTQYLNNLKCEWHIKIPLNQKIKLVFIKKFILEFSEDCSSDFLEIHDGPSIKSPLIGRYCGTINNFDEAIITNSNEVTLYFKSDISIAAHGFTIKYETFCGGTFTDNNGIIESPFYPNPYPDNKICIYLIEQPIGKAIQLSFLDMNIEKLSSDTDCYYDSLEIRDGDNENSTLIALLCGNIQTNSMLPYISTHNYMWLKFTTDHSNNNKGFRANYSTIDLGCGGILKNPTGTIQSPKHAEYYLHNQNCEWIITVNRSSRIQLTWLTFALENERNCVKDYVEVYDNSISGNASKIARYCGTKVPPILTSLGNQLTIIFKTDHSVALDGFMLTYSSLKNAQMCGGNFFTSEGFIQSPGFPDNYPNMKNCIWVINVPVTNQIELNITEFELEKSADCRFDFLEIRNGGYSTSPLIGKYCGTNILPIISSIGNSLFIKFVSDNSKSQKGFFMQWYTMTRGCGGILNSGVGHITSPNYPLPIQETLECFYKIVVVQGSKIKVTLLDIELNSDIFYGTCKENFLEFYDGGNTASKLLETLCSDRYVSTIIQSSSNQMFIKYRIKDFPAGRGFSLMYDTDCNVILKGHQGAIEITKQETQRLNNCSWTIMAPQGNRVNMTFTFLKVLKSRFKNIFFNRSNQMLKNHSYNTKLTIFEGANINQMNTVLWEIQPDSLGAPPLITSTTNFVRVSYNIENRPFMFEYDSFRMEWIVDGCGGVLKQFKGGFTSPGYPRSSPINSTCEWNIITEYGLTIQITIHEFSFESRSPCSSGSLLIYSGHDDSGPELLNICRTQTRPIIVTSGGNEAFVRFQSGFKSERKSFKATFITALSKCGGSFTAPQGIIHTTNYPHNYDSRSSCMWYIQIAETHLINLTFVDFNTRNNYPEISEDKVIVYDGLLDGNVLLNHSGNSIPPPIISSSNRLLVSFEVGKRNIRAKGFKAIYTMACGAKLITNDSGIITSDPSSVLHENCTWTIISDTPQSKVSLTFTHIDIVHNLAITSVKITNQTNDVCNNPYYSTIIRVLDGSDSDAPEIIKLCNSDRIPSIIVSNSPAIRIEFTGNSNGLDSFSAEYSVRSIACGGTYDTLRGTISTPNYPYNYFRDSECYWILKSSVGNRVSLNFIDFQLEEDEFCNEDYVEIRENDSIGTVLGIFCGPNLPTNITTSSALWVKFRSNSIGSAKGFTADFKYVTDNYLIQTSGEISNPMYPKIYRNSEDYSWTINVEENKKIRIVVKEFTSSSLVHYLKIYDGPNTEALTLLDRNSLNYNIDLNEAIFSSTNIVHILLKAGSKDIGGIIFLLSWTQVDKQNPEEYYQLEISDKESNFTYFLSRNTNASMIITSPGYPYGYSNDLHVNWTIHTDQYHHIEVKFLDVDLSHMRLNVERIFGDYITVKTVDPDTATTIPLKKIDMFYNTKTNDKVIGKNKVIISFNSDSLYNGTGFKAEVKTKCGSSLRELSGIIDTSYIVNDDYNICIWNVTVRPGKTVLVKLLNIQLISHKPCVDSYVLLKNGLNEDSPVLGQGKYCEKTELPELNTTNNKLQIEIKFKPGETIRMSFKEKSLHCGGQIHLNRLYNVTQITSPAFPDQPPAHTECIWIVVAPLGDQISLHIEDIDLSEDHKCKNEYLEFRDGAARFSPLISNICQDTTISDIKTTENFLYIKYFIGSSVRSNGFRLNVSIAKCGGVLRGLRGMIFSPNYPASYESNIDCEYRIIANYNYKISLNFDLVHLKQRFPYNKITSTPDNKTNNYSTTFDDSLSVYDVDPVNNTRVMITEIFGSNPPTSIVSAGRELVIIFKSHIENGPFYIKDEQAKFVIAYFVQYNGCDKMYSDVESGIITSPRYGLNVGRIYCTYTIKVPRGRRITAELVKGKSIGYNCVNDPLYNKQYNEQIIVVQRRMRYPDRNLCIDPVWKSSLSYVYESISNEMTLFYKYLSGTQVGFQIKFSSNKPSLCGGIVDASIKGKINLPFGNFNSYICQWSFTNMNGTTVIVANFNVTLDIINCRNNYLIMVTNEEETIDILNYCPDSNKTNEKYTAISPLPLTNLLVKSNSKITNLTATFEYFVNSCGGKIRGEKVTITSPNYPENYQQTTKCAWFVELNSETVTIHFNDIDLESSCDSNYLMIYNGMSPESPVLGKYCGNVVPENLVASTSSNVIWIVFSSDNGNSNKKGFNITLESTQVGCGNVYVSDTGEITSKNYPNLYPNNEECEWTISMKEGNRISLKFIERFNLEQSVNCTKDYLQIFDYIDGDWVPIVDRLCGRKVPPVFNSTETKLKIRLKTDSVLQGDGFKAIWKSFCGGIFTENSGRIISPNYPESYKSDIQCNYTILAPKKFIQLFFKTFDLEDSAKCYFDNLTIYNKVGKFDSKSEHLVGTYCGINVPQTMRFVHSAMLIFKTDDSIFYKGFEIHYVLQGCGGEIKTPGIIEPPTEVDAIISGVTSRLNCSWVIRAPPEQVIQLTFTQLNLTSYNTESETNAYNLFDNGSGCPDTDVLLIYDETTMKSNSSKFLGVLCNDYEKLPVIITSKTNKMIVQYKFENARNYKTFIGLISFIYDESKGCGGTIRLNASNNMSNYTLKLPKFPEKTTLDCGWLILVEPSYTVKIQVVNYVETPKCPSHAMGCGSIQFLDGPGRLAPKIHQFYPGNNSYPPLLSSGSVAFIRYRILDINYDVHFEINITTAISACGKMILPVTNQTEVLTSPNYPLSNGINLVCTWSLIMKRFNPVIMLRFTDLDLGDTKDCLFDYLEISYTPVDMTATSIRVCHKEHEFDLVSHTSSDVVLKLKTGGQTKSRGFRLEYTSSRCQTIYNKSNGRIIFDNAPGTVDSLDCTFTINATQPNATISVYFLKFLISGPPGENYLKVYDGPAIPSLLMSNMTGLPSNMSILPSPIFSHGSKLTFSYKVTGTLWPVDMIYTITDQGRGCGGRIFNSEGRVTSPLYPLIYKKSTACRWDISVPRPYSIAIKFEILDLSKSETCNTNYLEMFNVDQNTGKSSFIAKYCSGDIPDDHISQTGAVFIRYVTTVHNTGSGWVLNFKMK
ncbi:EGF-like, conserved site,EGF-like calcium-binding domain,CUB domain,EGF domain,EGF-like calcium- [Cinara cedri]|uniref:Cubilin n=1 Tax=Cinara cedri TaxID=506608 RepID=A0A5E4N6P5_9HEMI|nr:EGF-like, conserved site,EGF-like calcium-binding domain,CUB domain,EGF domain,EGF-like calcium- [Cinara cedri]